MTLKNPSITLVLVLIRKGPFNPLSLLIALVQLRILKWTLPLHLHVERVVILLSQSDGIFKRNLQLRKLSDLKSAGIVPLGDVGDGRLQIKTAWAGLSDAEADTVLGVKILLDVVARDIC